MLNEFINLLNDSIRYQQGAHVEDMHAREHRFNELQFLSIGKECGAASQSMSDSHQEWGVIRDLWFGETERHAQVCKRNITNCRTKSIS